MKGFYKIFLLFVCMAAASCTGMAQNLKNVVGPNPADDSLSDQEIINKFQKTTVKIKGAWALYDAATKNQIYQLYLPTETLAKAGIKFSATAVAVPVYVKTANGGYEPLLTDKKGQFNAPISAMTSGTGSIITSDGFILTTRSVMTGWKEAFAFAKDTPHGITMSADLKQIIDTNTAPPIDWVPEKTTIHKGNIGKFNVKLSPVYRYDGQSKNLEVTLPDETVIREAQIVMTSINSDVGMIKINVPGDLTKTEFLDNYDKLGKGEKLFLIHADSQAKQALMPIAVAEILRTSEKGDVISMTDKFDTSSGMPVYNNRGQVIGIYSRYDAKNNRHYIVPIKYGLAFIKN